MLQNATRTLENNAEIASTGTEGASCLPGSVRDRGSRLTGRCVQRWVAGSGAASPRPGLGRLAPAGCGAEPRKEILSDSRFKKIIS